MTAITPDDQGRWDWPFFIKGMVGLAATAGALFVATAPGTPVGGWIDALTAALQPAGQGVPAAQITMAAPLGMAALVADDRQRALHCLSQAVYYEARGEDLPGQAAVAQVVLNRLADPKYPKSVCGVVYQGFALKTGCQFTFTCDGSLDRPLSLTAWRRAEAVAEHALNRRVFTEVKGATNYHADRVSPYWRASLTKLTQVGRHVFYVRPEKVRLAVLTH